MRRKRAHAWQDKAAAVNQVANSENQGSLDINQTKDTFVNQTHAERQWAIGNQLVFKNRASWIWTGAFKNTAAWTSHRGMLPRTSAPRPTPTMPAMACTADFTSGLGFVNPSSTTSHKVTIPANAYKSLYGALQRGTITLAPQAQS